MNGSLRSPFTRMKPGLPSTAKHACPARPEPLPPLPRGFTATALGPLPGPFASHSLPNDTGCASLILTRCEVTPLSSGFRNWLRKINGYPSYLRQRTVAFPTTPKGFPRFMALIASWNAKGLGAAVGPCPAACPDAAFQHGAGRRARKDAQGAQVTRPVQAVPSTTSPKAMRYQAKGTKLWVEM